MSQYSKALVSFLVPVIMLFMQKFGITDTTSFMDALTIILTTGAVYIFPNQTPSEPEA